MNALLAKRIKYLRTENRLSQIELARKLGICNSTLSQYENGVNTPSDLVKIQIADYFEVTLDYLLGRTEVKRDSAIAGNRFIDVDGLNQDDIDFVNIMVEKLKNRK